MTHVTCRLTSKNRDQLRNPTLGNRVWATFTFIAELCNYMCCSAVGAAVGACDWCWRDESVGHVVASSANQRRPAAVPTALLADYYYSYYYSCVQQRQQRRRRGGCADCGRVGDSELVQHY